MNTMKCLAVSASLALVLAFGGVTYAGQVDQRQSNQQQRITEGQKSGQLTHQEAVKLRHQQQKIQQAKRRARRDGVVTPREQAQLNRMQNKASRDIHRSKQNNVTQ